MCPRASQTQPISVSLDLFNTVCLRGSDPILYSKLLYKMGQYFLDIQYNEMKKKKKRQIRRKSLSGYIYLNWTITVNLCKYNTILLQEPENTLRQKMREK